MYNLIDLSNKKFGRLFVVERKGSIGNRPLWRCICDCGTEALVLGEKLRYGGTKSCGCLVRDTTIARSTTHGLSNTRFWQKWRSMRQRCLDKNSAAYYKYGAKGVTVCERWLNFDNFKADLFESYSKHVSVFGEKETTLDRIDPLKNYSPENCRWATNKQQGRNRTNNKLLTYKEVTLPMVEWAERMNISQDVVEQRINLLKWSVEDALTKPVRQFKRP